MSGSAAVMPENMLGIGLSVKTRTKRRHHRDDAIHNAKRILQEETDSGVAALTMKCIGDLLDCMTQHKNSLYENSEAMRDLEALTNECLLNLPDKCVLHSIMKEGGWGGMRFHFNSEEPVDVEFLMQVLSSLYMSKSQTELGDNESIIKSYFPNHLVALIDQSSIKNIKDSAPDATSILQFYGTCMLVDISGFTKLSAALCTQGSAGLDALHAAISGYLGKCIDIVYRHGGDGKCLCSVTTPWFPPLVYI